MGKNKKKISQQQLSNAVKRSNEYKSDIRQADNRQVAVIKSKDSYKILLYLFIILVLTGIVYSNSLKNDFANWDDDEQINKNNDIKELSAVNIEKFFTKNYVGMYQPLTSLSFAIEYHYFGLKAKGYHIDNLILHLLDIILVFFFIYLLTKKINVAGIVALFFGIHPMHVESVTWITERKDVLYSFFFLAGLICYVYYVKKSKILYLIYSLLLFLLSAFTKSAAVCFPLVIFLINYYFNVKTFDKSLKILSIVFIAVLLLFVDGINFHPLKIIFIENITDVNLIRLLAFIILLSVLQLKKFKMREASIQAAFLIIAILFGIISINSQKTSGAIADLTPLFSIIDRVFLACYVTTYYIIKLFIPTGLCAMHYFPAKQGGFLPLEYYLSSIFVAGIIYLLFSLKSKRYGKDIIFGFLFYIATIILIMQLLPVGFAITAERYTYIPYIGLLLPLAIISNTILEDKKDKLYKMRPVLMIILGAFTLIFSIQTYSRNPVWHDGIVLFTDVIEKNPESFHGYWIRGSAYSNKEDYKNAIADFNDALLRKAPNPAEVLNNRGDAKNKINDYSGAFADLTQAIKLKPDLPEAYCNRGNAEDNLGEFDRAIKDYNKALSIKPDMITAYINKGVTMGKIGKMDESIKLFDKAVSMNPLDASAYLNRGNARGLIKDFKGSIADYDMSIKLKGNESGAYFNRAISKLSIHDTTGACQDWQKALEMGNKAAEGPIANICNKRK